MTRADRILRNACVLTMDAAARSAQAVAVKDGRILAVGSDREILAHAGPETAISNLTGFTVLPGFIDTNSHMARTGLMHATQVDLCSPPLGSILSLEELVGALRARALATAKGGWIIGFGYDDTLLAQKRHPLAADLDRACPDNPVLLSHISGRLCACNSRALALGGIGRDTPDPAGGLIFREDGIPQGVLKGTAMDLVRRHIPAPSREDWLRGLALASAIYAAKGITTAQEAWACDMVVRMLAAANALIPNPVRIRVRIPDALGAQALAPMEGTLAAQDTLALEAGGNLMADRRFAVQDRLLQAVGADFPHGLERVVQGREISGQGAHSDGHQVGTSLRPGLPDTDRGSDQRPVILRALRPGECSEAAYKPFRPGYAVFVPPMDPLLAVCSAVTRSSRHSRIHPEARRVPVLEALRAVTSRAAFQIGEGHCKGSLEPGKLADMVVLDTNPLQTPFQSLGDIGVLATLVGGETIHGTL